MAKHRILGFESKGQPLLSPAAFARRLAASFAISLLLIGASLLGGMAGYAHYEGMGGVDAFVNASMILSGMGPLAQPQTNGGKIFAGLYALYSGLALILATGILLSPVVHRMLHRFHIEDK